jgi:hypothetical protein
MRIASATLAALLAAAAPAFGACTWEWLCNGEGACKHMPVCDSVHETPPPKPSVQPPAMPPLSMRPHKLAGNLNSALTCEHIMRQGRSGRWYWAEACYCQDKAKAIDASDPFANIVRCDGGPPVTSASPASTPAPK